MSNIAPIARAAGNDPDYIDPDLCLRCVKVSVGTCLPENTGYTSTSSSAKNQQVPAAAKQSTLFIFQEYIMFHIVYPVSYYDILVPGICTVPLRNVPRGKCPRSEEANSMHINTPSK